MWEFFLGKILDFFSSIFRNRKGIVAEWREPDWFSFGSCSYSNLLPQSLELWLRVYFRNTTDEPHILQAVSADFTREGRFWGGHFSAAWLDISSTSASFPQTIMAKGSLHIFLRFIFTIGADTPKHFVSQLNESPDLLFKVTYHVKEGAKTKEKIMERSFKFKDEFKKAYKKVLENSDDSNAKRLLQLLN